MRRTQVAAMTAGAVVIAGAVTALAPQTAVAATPAMAWDFNGDGFADVAVGAFAEDIGSVRDAGNMTILPGSADQVETSGAQAFSQDSAGVPGVAQKFDEFGWDSASGDINSDGYADLVVGAPGEGFSGAPFAGVITVLYGSATGLTGTGSESRTEPVPSEFASYGIALAVGDFNGDGFADTAVGASGTERVYVYTGSASGLADDGVVWSQASPGVPGARHINEAFGLALAAGDVNNDGLAELAVGAPYDISDGQDVANGSVTLLYGSASAPGGLTSTGAQHFSRDRAGVQGTGHTYSVKDAPDSFGLTVALGDLNGDSFADLTVGGVGTPVTSGGKKRQDAGAINLLRGTAGGVATAGDQYLSQDSPGIPGAVHTRAYWGATLATGDVEGDAKDEVAVAAIGTNVVVVLGGVDGNVGTGTDQLWSQDSPGIAGNKEVEDEFGSSLRFEHVLSDLVSDLVIGAPGENNARGAITFLGGTGSGLSGGNAQNFTQDTPGVPGTAEPDDVFGSFF